MWTTMRTDSRPRPAANLATIAHTEQPAILLVEDDRDVRQLIVMLLKRVANAAVYDAPNGEAALALLQNIGRPVQLLISDINLGPGINGIDMAHQVAELSPATRIVLMSGDHSYRQGLPAKWGFIEKPFALPEFILEVKASCEDLSVRPNALTWSLRTSAIAALRRR